MNRNELIERLEAVSQNNSAYVEVLGPDINWLEEKEEILLIQDIEDLLEKVVELEEAHEKLELEKVSL